MIGDIHKGASVRGAIAYAVDDSPERKADQSGKPRGRVAWIQTLNLPTDDAELAGRIMTGVVYDAPTLKTISGHRAGRPLKKPAVHLILSYHESEMKIGDVTKRRKEILDTVRSALGAVGLADRQAVIVAHVDRDHLHVHVIASRVSPETGLAADMTDDHHRISAWAEEYERSRGNVVCPERVARREQKDLRPEERRPRPPSKMKIGPGRRPRTRYEKAAWDSLFAKYRRERTPLATRKVEKLTLRRRLDVRHDRLVRWNAVVTTVTRALKRIIPGVSTPAALIPTPPAPRRLSHGASRGPARYAAPVDATPVKPAAAAVPRRSLARRIDNALYNEDRRDKRATNRATKAAANAAAALEAKQALDAELRAAAGIKLEHDAALIKEYIASIKDRPIIKDRLRQAARPAVPLPPTREKLPPPAAEPVKPPAEPVKPISVLEELQKFNAHEDRKRAARAPGPVKDRRWRPARQRPAPIETPATQAPPTAARPRPRVAQDPPTAAAAAPAEPVGAKTKTPTRQRPPTPPLPGPSRSTPKIGVQPTAPTAAPPLATGAADEVATNRSDNREHPID